MSRSRISLVADLSFMSVWTCHICLHLYLNSVIFSSRNSVNIILISVAVSRSSLHCQSNSLRGNSGQICGLSDSPTFQFLRNLWAHCRKSSLSTLRVYTLVESNHGHKRAWKILWIAQSLRWHLNHTYFLTDILTHSLAFLTPFLTWVPAFHSLIMLWRFHS